MICTVNNIVETLYNPEGRFRTLIGITLDESDSKEPVLNYSDALVSFQVHWQGKPYILKCFLNQTGAADIALRQTAAYLMNIKSKYLVDCQYRGAEMLVFDDRDQSSYIDIILMESPEGVLLGRFLTQAADQLDARRIDYVLREFCHLSYWLLGERLVHGWLKPSNILVTSQGELKLLNYERMRVYWMDGFSQNIDDDNIAVANIALGLKVLTADPSIFRALNGNSIFRLPILRSSLLPIFSDLASQARCTPMQALTEMLSNCNYILRDRMKLMKTIEELANDTTELSSVLLRTTLSRLYTHKEAEEVLFFPAKALNLSQYEWVSFRSEGLRCVERQGCYGFVDDHGEVAIPLRYSWADDFHEGRTVVRIDENFAFLDKNGEEILPPIYESLDWNSEYGIVLAAYEGKMGVFDRKGQELAPMIYDWIGPAAQLILVRKNGLCGYITSRGEVAIPLRYDDAFDFKADGTALVIVEGREYYINTKGEAVDRIYQPHAVEYSDKVLEEYACSI